MCAVGHLGKEDVHLSYHDVDVCVCCVFVMQERGGLAIYVGLRAVPAAAGPKD